jgi:hypothetical protein
MMSLSSKCVLSIVSFFLIAIMFIGTAYAVPTKTTTISLTSSANPSIVTNPITFTATVSAEEGDPTGIVSFYDGNMFLGAVVLSNGQAAYTTSSLSIGAHSISAVYSGDNTYSSCKSSAIDELVQDFTMGSTNVMASLPAKPLAANQDYMPTLVQSASPKPMPGPDTLLVVMVLPCVMWLGLKNKGKE